MMKVMASYLWVENLRIMARKKFSDQFKPSDFISNLKRKKTTKKQIRYRNEIFNLLDELKQDDPDTVLEWFKLNVEPHLEVEITVNWKGDNNE